MHLRNRKCQTHSELLLVYASVQVSHCWRVGAVWCVGFREQLFQIVAHRSSEVSWLFGWKHVWISCLWLGVTHFPSFGQIYWVLTRSSSAICDALSVNLWVSPCLVACHLDFSLLELWSSAQAVTVNWIEPHVLKASQLVSVCLSHFLSNPSQWSGSVPFRLFPCTAQCISSVITAPQVREKIKVSESWQWRRGRDFKISATHLLNQCFTYTFFM